MKQDRMHAVAARLRSAGGAVLVGVLLAACASTPTQLARTDAGAPLAETLKGIEGLSSEPKRLAKVGIERLLEGQYAEASKRFNAALQLSPAESYLQLLNGLAYHLQASGGDSEKYALAEQGYRLAIQFDGSNWLARYYLGNLLLDRRQYAAAQSVFAEALLYADSDRELLYQLAAASYYAGDPATAAAALTRLDTLKPDSPAVQRGLAITLAALGRFTESDAHLARYRTLSSDARAVARFEERLRNWRNFHATEPGSLMPTQFTLAPGGGAAGGPPTAAAGGNPYGGPTSPPAAAPTPAVDPAVGQRVPTVAGERMVLVDVVILRTEDEINTRKGVNLLSSLTVQFGSSTAPAFGKSRSRTTTDDGTTLTINDTRSITRAITIPALTYSLNIVNSNSDSNEILARPTIAALEGVRSEFFSGTNLSAAAVAAPTASGYGSAIQIEKEIGVRLAITPNFVGDDRVRLEVVAERTFVQAPNSDVNFTYKLETSKTTVNAQTVLKFGETLILSGLSEKETNRTRDGVPLLQDVPVLQYLFSRSETRTFQRSVLILVTPRPATFIYRDEGGEAALIGATNREMLDELRARHSDWFRPYPNHASVFYHLGSSRVYREFRTGDVALEPWDRQATLAERLRQVVDFIYY